MRKFRWFGVAAVVLVLVVVVVPAARYVAMGALAMLFLATLYIVCSGLTREGERRAQVGEVERRARGIAWRRAQVRREARWQADVEAAKRRISER